MRDSTKVLLAILACCLINACSKPVSVRMEGSWEFDQAASSANWDSLNTPEPARRKIMSLVDSGTIEINNGKVTMDTNRAKASVGYEILKDGERFLVARIESRDGRKRADINVKMTRDDTLVISSDYPLPGATAILKRKSSSE